MSGPNPSGLCMCGCGGLAPISSHTRSDRGYRAGEPCRYILGHQLRRRDPQYVVDPTTGCWMWQHYEKGDGYGGIRDAGRDRSAHIVFYERKYGPVPPGKQLDHICRRRACVNPDHLEPVTQMVNCQRGASAKLTPADVVQIRARFAAGDVTQIVLGAEYGVTSATISNVVLGRTWRNVIQPGEQAA